MDAVTLVIPTYDRYGRLVRLLRYLAGAGTGFPVVVLDSSSHEPDERALRSALDAAEASYFRVPSDVPPIEKIAGHIGDVATPLVALCADDDLVVPATLQAAGQHLQEHPACAAVHGRSLIATVKPVRGGNEVVALDPYPQGAVAAATGAERLFSYLTDYFTTFYSVQRTDHLAENLQTATAEGFGHFWGEYFLGCSAVIRGDVERLDDLYLVRECHAGMDTFREQDDRVDFFDFLTLPEYTVLYPAFCERLAELIARTDGVGENEARTTVKRAWWAHNALGLCKEYESAYGAGPLSMAQRAKRIVKRTPGLRGLVPYAQGLALRHSDRGSEELSLNRLLDETSPHHAAFAPIYDALRKPLEERA